MNETKLRKLEEITKEEAKELFEINRSAMTEAEQKYITNPYPDEFISPVHLSYMAVAIVEYLHSKGFDVKINNNEHQDKV